MIPRWKGFVSFRNLLRFLSSSRSCTLCPSVPSSAGSIVFWTVREYSVSHACRFGGSFTGASTFRLCLNYRSSHQRTRRLNSRHRNRNPNRPLYARGSAGPAVVGWRAIAAVTVVLGCEAVRVDFKWTMRTIRSRACPSKQGRVPQERPML